MSRDAAAKLAEELYKHKAGLVRQVPRRIRNRQVEVYDAEFKERKTPRSSGMSNSEGKERPDRFSKRLQNRKPSLMNWWLF